MIIIKDKIKELRSISANDTYILTDFDGTITKNSSDSSWTSIFKNPNVTDEFIQECLRIFNYYHKYEINKLCDKEITITKGRLGKPYFFIKDPNGILMEIIEE